MLGRKATAFFLHMFFLLWTMWENLILLSSNSSFYRSSNILPIYCSTEGLGLRAAFFPPLPFTQSNAKMHTSKKRSGVNGTTLQQSCNNFIQPFLIIIIFSIPFSYRNSLSIRAQDRKLLYYSYSSLVWVLLMKQPHNQMKIMLKKTCIISLGLNYQEI